MTAVKIKFTGIVKKFGASSSGGEELVISEAKVSDPKKLLELAEAKKDNKQKVEGTIALIQQPLL